MTEKQLQTRIIHFLNMNGCYVWNVNSGKIPIKQNGRTRFFTAAPTGHSDIQGIHKASGRFIAIEVKLPERRKYVTDPQLAFINDIKEFGGIAGVATSEDTALDIILSSLNK